MTTPDEIDPEPVEEPVFEAPRRAPRPEREAPHDLESERHVLACCLIDDGHTLDAALRSGLTPASFYQPDNASIFSHLRRMRGSGIPIGLDTLMAEMPRAELDGIGIQYLLELSAPTTAKAGYHIERLRALQIDRDTIRIARRLAERPQDAPSLLEELQSVRLQGERAQMEAAAIALTQSRVTVAKAPAEPAVRLYLANKPIATPGNLQTIISRAKTGKSAALGAAVSAIVAASTSTLDKDTLGFKASNPAGMAVLVLDTEQSPYDAYLCYHRSLRRVDHPEDPDWLYHFSLVGQTPEQLKTSLDAALASAKRLHGGTFMVILDGVADFVHSVNDESECNGFVTWLRTRAVTHDTPILCVIHSNEGVQSGDDGRGHLGKQLIRKSESNLTLKKEGDTTTITSDKQRKAPITEADNIAFRWDEERQMHVSVSAPAPAKKGAPPKYSIEDFWDFIPKPTEPHDPLPIILNRVQSAVTIRKDVFTGVMERARRDGQVDRIIDKVKGACFRQVI